jgi:lipoate-protein ligase B
MMQDGGCVQNRSMSVLTVYKLGIVNYKKALELQLSLLNKIKRGEVGDTLLLLEHPPTFTVGRRGKPEHLLKNVDELKNRGICFEIVGRGGDITFHGPGQLVGYPILDLNNHKCDIHLFLRNIEEVIIDALSDFDITGERKTDYTGVWVRDEKIASIGIGVKRWTTYHGFALNVNTDLSYFDIIVPCGIPGIKMTSIRELLGNKRDIDMSGVKDSIVGAFSRVFEMNPHVSSNCSFVL